jgi:PRTRC genetic system ThiF family protein
MELDLTHTTARTVLVPQYHHLHLLLIGCGGTGSYLAEHVARLTRVLREQGKDVRVTFVDDDVVTRANVPRQHFCEAEIGAPKAAALALRCNAAWGLDIRAILDRFTPAHLGEHGYGTVTLLLGCVDNAAARQSLAEALRPNAREEHPRIWWLDAGNFADAGQVMLGTDTTLTRLAEAFITPGLCGRLPAPSLAQPDLLVPQPDELPDARLSCADLAALNAQSLVINQAMAMLMTQYLTALLLTSTLRQCATTLNLPALSMRTTYVTPETLAPLVGQSPSWFHAMRPCQRRPQEEPDWDDDDEDT